MSVELNWKTCDTIGCHALATHVLTWRDRDTDDEHTENVCERDGVTYTYRPALRAMLAPMAKTPAPQSGYTPCACRDCMDIAVSSDMRNPELCSECADAGCDSWSSREGRSAFDCQRDDAYEECCTCDYLKAQYDPAYRQCAFCASLEAEC